MKSKIAELLQDDLILKVSQAFIAVNFLFLAIIIWKWRELPPELPLFYSLPRSNEQLTTPFDFLLLPFFSILIFAFHFILAVFIYKWEKLAAKILLISALTISVALLMTFVRIILLIT
ncbi:hypothetical protein A2W14_06395 [Candidatus Gottesmanbacteria bacterium RBG_16_37_8]|uniref:DUF1648 domain-containing protein n=1 Tax=Candidatus Gottesmanbacteria bacterium RBG_16_37_8 TaxID=1798371 RepID=A0A1F5YPA2_9BACT|nr:MAG: hypothetical protein A2W14_06395 [Candidatus Gottesmanbacteria bacterium RBG_16_37_8]